ncbi:hypothetical protein JG687_00014106 [Phytophthora cactorum]|uniref:Uncharacterized protein n=1 Tax=Phytophthora cactorum TaxID=29920 RepID=A0A8T1TZJ7_9STRA|nr:hypothetical protein JG687_00014106 [Phytophthora cactorum]
MVRVTRPPSPAYTSPQVVGFYFRPYRGQDDEVILEYFHCRCGTVRKQTHRNGYSNLMQLVLREHPDYVIVMLEATAAQTGSIFNFICHYSQNLFGWMVWIVQCNLPLSFCESREARRIMLDGWTHASEHYVAVFASYEVNGSLKIPLLSVAPMLSEVDDDLSAESRHDFLAAMLTRDHGVQLEQYRFVLSDNCSVNRRLTTLMEVPLVSCASHRLNLAVQDDLQGINKIWQPSRETRWGSTFAMVKRYFELLEFIDVEDDDIMELLPAPAPIKRLRILYQELRDILSVSEALQVRDVDLLDVREWFDELVSVKP